MITTKLLKSLHACEKGITFFKKHFPSGEASFAKVIDTCCENGAPGAPNYTSWLAIHCPDIPGATWEVRLGLQKSNDGRAYLARHCPNIPGATWKARLALQHTDHELASLAYECPDIPDATWEARLTLPKNNNYQGYIARFCPDIPGATWEARLSLLGNNYDRTIFERLFPKPVRAALGKGKPNPNP